MPNYMKLELIADRIKLIPISMDYAHALCEHFTAEITKYMWPSAPKAQEEINQHISLKQDQMKKGEEISLFIINKENDDFLGYVSIHQAHSKTPELGIWLKKEAHGHKYGYEALDLLIRWAEKNIEYNYLKYPVDKANMPSRKLAEKLGGKVEDEYIKTSESGNVLDEVEYRFYKNIS
jgi:RimJ/RimL family protein N-acetyltransferase